MRQQRRAHRSMRRGEHSTNRSRKAMNGSESGIGQREAAQQSRASHVLARRAVAAVLKGAPKRTRDAWQALATERIRERIGAQAHERLDQLGERVKTGAGGKVGWEIVCEFGID